MERVAIPLRGRLTAVPATVDVPGALVVRPLHLDDASELGQLMFGAYRGTVDDHGETAEWHLREAEGTVAGAFGPVLWGASFVAIDGERLVGTSLVTEERGLPLLAFALVLPEYQGRGLGTALIIQSAAYLRSAGWEEWTLAVTEGSPAERLYKRLGFAADHTVTKARAAHPEGGEPIRPRHLTHPDAPG